MKSLQIKSLGWMALGILMGFGSQWQVLMQPNSAIAVEAVNKNLAWAIASTKPKTTTKSIATGTQIGPAIDCDGDGQQNDARIDHDGDGIPDECLIGNQAVNSKTPEIQSPSDRLTPARVRISAEWQAMQQQLETCKVSRKSEKLVVYSVWVCKNGQIAKAAEAQAEVGDGLGYWLRGDQIRAVQFFHTGEVWFFKNGQLEAILTDSTRSQVKMTFSQEELAHARKLLPDGHLNILQVFELR